MNRSLLRLLAGAAAGVLLIAGCTSAAHLKVLQPAAVPVSPAIVPPGAAAAQPRQMQLGIDVDAYTYPGQNITAAATATMAYVRSLHANSVSVAFPFYMDGPQAAGVHAGPGTPNPAQVAKIIQEAQADGLHISLRPLLDEASLGGMFRGRLHLTRPHQWFASYQHFLQGYTQVAQSLRVPTVIVGTELTSLRKSPLWNPMNAALRRHYSGHLQFDSNWWGFPRLAGAGGTNVQEAVDAYPPLKPPLGRAWRGYDSILPPRTILSEVGIAAAPGAFTMPWLHHWPGAPLDTGVQARWFTAACHAAAATHLGGIYFWSVGLSAQPRTGPSVASQLTWAGGQGAQAISQCFAGLSGKAAK